MSRGGKERPREVDAAAAVLAGGEGRRLGADKTSLEIGGKPVLDGIVEQLSQVFSRLLLVVKNGGSELEGRYGPQVRVVRDMVAGKGPLVGIYTALELSPAPYVFIMACDMPYPNPDLVRRLLSLAPGREAVVPRRGEYIEPLFAVYSRGIRERARERVESNRLKIHTLIDELDVRYLEEEEIAACDPGFRSFFNINTPEDLGQVL